uniref:Uncharacterized protein n=1 Tax=Arundo donax TaxID=35708 RepID=A0A0A9GQD0_ARUDO
MAMQGPSGNLLSSTQVVQCVACYLFYLQSVAYGPYGSVVGRRLMGQLSLLNGSGLEIYIHRLLTKYQGLGVTDGVGCGGW